MAAREREERAEVVVRDCGIGIATEETQKVFSAFYRGDAARSMSNGVGIGLTVCRRLIEALGGRIWAEPLKGGGSEFGFCLPHAVERDSE